jgi:hypothetical protein
MIQAGAGGPATSGCPSGARLGSGRDVSYNSKILLTGMGNDDEYSIHHSTKLFAAGFIIGLIIFSMVTTSARHGLEVSSCPASVLETGNPSNRTHRIGTVHRVSLDIFSLSITVQGRLPFIFKYKCHINETSESTYTNQESSMCNKNSESSPEQKHLADFRNDVPDHYTPSSKTSFLAEESHNEKTNEAEPSLSSQWQWAYGAGVQDPVSDFGSYSAKYLKDMYSEAKDRNLKKNMRDRIWHYKYGSGRLDESAKPMNKKKNCTGRTQKAARR